MWQSVGGGLGLIGDRRAKHAVELYSRHSVGRYSRPSIPLHCTWLTKSLVNPIHAFT
jgi:hypothetical protein